MVSFTPLPLCYPQEKSLLSSLDGGLVKSPRIVLEAVKKMKISCPCRDLNYAL
jgi:hypothetical protein